MDTKTAGRALILVGAVMAIVGVTADTIGLGSDPGFGVQQLSMTVAGIIVVFAGAILQFAR